MNLIEANLRRAFKDPSLCQQVLGNRPDKPNWKLNLVNNPNSTPKYDFESQSPSGCASGENCATPNPLFEHALSEAGVGDGGGTVKGYNVLSLNGQTLVEQDKVLDTGLVVTQLRLVVDSLGQEFSDPLNASTKKYLYYTHLFIRGAYPEGIYDKSAVLQMAAGTRSVGAIIPLTVVVSKQGDMLSCSLGEVSGTKGCRVASSPDVQLPLLPWVSSCNPDEVLVSGGAKCGSTVASDLPYVQINAPFFQNFWVADCGGNLDPSNRKVSIYAYCCPN